MLKISFIGGGNMSSCIIDGILKSSVQCAINVSGPHLDKLEQRFANKPISLFTDNIKACIDSDIIFLGVKPQILNEVLDNISSCVNCSEKIIVSMATGFRLHNIQEKLAAKYVLRIMPNTPSKIGQGVIGIYYNENIDDKKKDIVKRLLKPLGLLVELHDEQMINTISALCGSSPAFLFRFLNSLINIAKTKGFDEQEARAMITHLAIGCANLVQANKDQSLDQMIDAVTSKGGTTYEGLKVMSAYKFEDMISDVIQACLDKNTTLERMLNE